MLGRDQGGCERRIEVFVKIKKKQSGRGVGSWGIGGGGGRIVWGSNPGQLGLVSSRPESTRRGQLGPFNLDDQKTCLAGR